MERVLTELTPECEVTARMYAQGYEKKEIASMKCRALSTINNQLQERLSEFFELETEESWRQCFMNE